MSIIQNMLGYYIKQMQNVGPLKSKIMKLTYIRKVAFNINGTTFCTCNSTNQQSDKFKALSEEKYKILVKIYDKLQMLIINEISLISNKMLTLIECRLHDIKQAHTINHKPIHNAFKFRDYVPKFTFPNNTT